MSSLMNKINNEWTVWKSANMNFSEIVAQAWLDGYTVEKEKLYTVEIPNPNLNAYVVLQKTGDGLVLVTVGNAGWAEWESSKLTEAEIKNLLTVFIKPPCGLHEFDIIKRDSHMRCPSQMPDFDFLSFKANCKQFAHSLHRLVPNPKFWYHFLPPLLKIGLRFSNSFCLL